MFLLKEKNIIKTLKKNMKSRISKKAKLLAFNN